MADALKARCVIAEVRWRFLNVTEAQGESDIKPDRLLDNLERVAVAAIADGRLEEYPLMV
jgi:hypothetical protein